MKTRVQTLQGTCGNDPEWITELAFYYYVINTEDLTEEENRKLILKLFLEYRRDGLSPLDALKKAKLVFDRFKR